MIYGTWMNYRLKTRLIICGQGWSKIVSLSFQLESRVKGPMQNELQNELMISIIPKINLCPSLAVSDRPDILG